MYELKGMEFDGYKIDMIMKRAEMYYMYNDCIITILMNQDQDGTAKGSIKDGKTADSFGIPSSIGEIQAVTIEGKLGNKYMTEFIYDNTYYHIYGELPKEEFINLVSSIFF